MLSVSWTCAVLLNKVYLITCKSSNLTHSRGKNESGYSLVPPLEKREAFKKRWICPDRLFLTPPHMYIACYHSGLRNQGNRILNVKPGILNVEQRIGHTVHCFTNRIFSSAGSRCSVLSRKRSTQIWAARLSHTDTGCLDVLQSWTANTSLFNSQNFNLFSQTLGLFYCT